MSPCLQTDAADVSPVYHRTGAELSPRRPGLARLVPFPPFLIAPARRPVVRSLATIRDAWRSLRVSMIQRICHIGIPCCLH
jgi:hypothetical protein